MADDPNPAPPIPEPTSENPPDAPPVRKVYQPTLFAERRRRLRASPWLVIPGLLLVLGGLLFLLLTQAHRARFVRSAGTIVYASDHGSPGTPHLWVAQFDGSGAHLLVPGSAADTQPAFAPGGSQIAFISNREENENQVFVADADGKNIVQMTHSTGSKSQPAWDFGTPGLLGYTAGGAVYDVSVGGEGSGGDRLLPPPPSAHPPQDSDQQLAEGPTVTVPSFAWSPASNGGLAAVEDTGTFQAFAVSSSLAAAPIDVHQTPQGDAPLLAGDTLSLGWNHAGTLLAVAALNVQGAPRPLSGLFLFGTDGTMAPGRPPFLVGSASIGPQNPVFSPDGTQILIEAWSQPDLASRRRLGLALIPTDGSAPPRFIYRGDASDAQFSPDGSILFFLASRPDGGHDLCRVAPDGSGFARLTDGHEDITGFSVSPQVGGH